VATWITIAIGSVVGLLYRRYAATRPFGGFTDALLGITGAFSARWFVDNLHLIGLNFGSFSWLLVACGAALLPWSFHGFRRRSASTHQLGPSDTHPQEGQLKKTALATELWQDR